MLITAVDVHRERHREIADQNCSELTLPTITQVDLIRPVSLRFGTNYLVSQQVSRMAHNLFRILV